MYISNSKEIVLGWSCWGFLGKGIVDTPDGGRCHRYPLIKQIIEKGIKVIMLQENRDLNEVGENYEDEYLTFSYGFPDINALFVEYRWPIQNRNIGLSRDDVNYTPDWDRQKELLDFYGTKDIPILIWDKDQKMKDEIGIVKNKNTFIFEACLFPKLNRGRLLFPMSSEIVKMFKQNIGVYKKSLRIIDLVYIGNQYERDDSFDKYINIPAGSETISCEVYGNWTKYPLKYKENALKFKNVKFNDRVGFEEIYGIYRESFATVLIAPERYYKSGQFTQRIFESISQLCIPLTPKEYKGVNQVVIDEFIVSDSKEVVSKIEYLKNCDQKYIVNLLTKQLQKLLLFDVEEQCKVILETISNSK